MTRTISRNWLNCAMVVCATLSNSGCESDQEKCNAARVRAHDAWTAYATLAQGEAERTAQAFNSAEAPARTARDQACVAAWNAYSTELAQRDGESLRHGGLGLAIGVLVVAHLERSTTPCEDPRPAETQAQETRAVNAGEIPQALIRTRSDALRRAQADYEQAVGSLRQRRDRAATLALAAATARDQATERAIPARDAFRAVPEDAEHPERQAAWEASEAAWEACQNVDP